MAPTVEAQHLRKAFGRKAVLTDVTFALPRATLASIEGENGSGKTTLLKLLVGLLRPGGGSVVVRGRLGYCPQQATLFESLTVGEHFRYFAAAYGLPEATWTRAMVALMERLRFAPEVGTRVTHLSGGTRQKLNFALALLHAPDVLVLDEPYAGFDWETYLRFWEVAADLKERGASVLIVSHLVYDRSRLDLRYRLVEGVLQCV